MVFWIIVLLIIIIIAIITINIIILLIAPFTGICTIIQLTFLIYSHCDKTYILRMTIALLISGFLSFPVYVWKINQLSRKNEVLKKHIFYHYSILRSLLLNIDQQILNSMIYLLHVLHIHYQDGHGR